MYEFRTLSGIKQGIPNIIETKLEDFFRGSIANIGRQLVPRFGNADRKSELAACQMGQLMTKLEVMATKNWIGGCLGELVSGEFHPLMEYVIHQDQARDEPTTVDQVSRAVFHREMPETFD